ncbi:MAG TPA: site-2 protease family protein [Polyangia bacterium]|nr:site-2 protease family protein [Polyangia bacterium]
MSDDGPPEGAPGEASDVRGGEPLAPRAAGKPWRPPLIVHAALFLATFLTTTMSGAIHAHATGDIAPIGDGLSYSVPLMLILLCHELGHYFVARWHGVDASLPFFIPFPPWFGLGTMGAVIQMRRATTDRKKLIDVGAAGPLAGLAVAVPVLLWGLARSKVGPLLPTGALEGNSLLYACLKHASKGLWLPDGHQDVYLHPTAYAGWVGLLVTMINLLPIGQLDGGHVATAYFGNRYNAFARRLHAVMPLVSVGVFFWVRHLVRVEMGAHYREGVAVSIAFFASMPWLVWYGLVGAVRRASGGVNHPPVQPRPLPASRRALFWLMVLVFVAIFMPVPFRESITGEGAAPGETTAVAP